MPASDLEIAENLRTRILTTLFQPQDHFPAVSHVPVGKLVDSNFDEIDISSPAIRSLGRVVGFDKMPGDLTLGCLLQRLNATCKPQASLNDGQIRALIDLSSSLIEEDDAWEELRSLWKFFSKAELPRPYDLGSAPVIDPLCNLVAPPRYKLLITFFQYIDCQDEETGEEICHICEMPDPLYTDSLDKAVSQIRPACQRAIDDMVKARCDGTSFLRWAQIFEGEKLILSIQYNVPDDCRQANKKGIGGYSLSSNEIFTSGLTETLVSSLRRDFGRSFLDKVSENNLARDLGL